MLWTGNILIKYISVESRVLVRYAYVETMKTLRYWTSQLMSSSPFKILFKRISFFLILCPKSAVQMSYGVSSPVYHKWTYPGSMWRTRILFRSSYVCFGWPTTAPLNATWSRSYMSVSCSVQERICNLIRNALKFVVLSVCLFSSSPFKGPT